MAAAPKIISEQAAPTMWTPRTSSVRASATTLTKPSCSMRERARPEAAKGNWLVDLVDSSSDRLVYRSLATKTFLSVPDRDKLERQLERIAVKMFRKLPETGGTAAP